MEPVNLSMLAVDPERVCPYLSIANAGDSCATAYYSCHLVTPPSSEDRLELHDLRGSASPKHVR